MRKIVIALLVLLAVRSSASATWTDWDNIGPQTISTTNNIGGPNGGAITGTSGLRLDVTSLLNTDTRLSIVHWGSIDAGLDALDNASVTMIGNASIGNSLQAFNSVTVIMSDTSSVGSTLRVLDQANATLSGNVSIGSFVDVFHYASLNMSDNVSVTGPLFAKGNAVVTIHDNASIAGPMIRAADNATIQIYVSEFTIDGFTYSNHGDIYYLSDFGAPFTNGKLGTISGIMEAGDPFANNWEVRNAVPPPNRRQCRHHHPHQPKILHHPKPHGFQQRLPSQHHRLRNIDQRMARLHLRQPILLPINNPQLHHQGQK